MADSIITPDLITLDADLGADTASVIAALAARLAAAGRATDPAPVAAAALAREAQSATGLPGGIAIPHCRVPEIATASLCFARLSPKVDFGGPDGPADLVFLIAAPEGAGAAHMKLLSSLARALVRPAFVTALREAPTAADVVRLVEEVVSPPRKALPERRARHRPPPAPSARERRPVRPERIPVPSATPDPSRHRAMRTRTRRAAPTGPGTPLARGVIRRRPARRSP